MSKSGLTPYQDECLEILAEENQVIRQHKDHKCKISRNAHDKNCIYKAKRHRYHIIGRDDKQR